MRIAEVETIPLRPPLRATYVTAARARSTGASCCCCGSAPTTAIEGLGEAVPLALRGGADTAGRSTAALLKGTRRLKRADPRTSPGRSRSSPSVDAFVHAAAGRRLPGAGGAALEMAIFDLAGKLRPAAVEAAPRRRRRRRCLQRHAARRRARPRWPPRRALGRAGLRDVQAQDRHGQGRRAGARGPGGRRARRPDPRRRERRPRHAERRSGCCGCRAARRRARRAAGRRLRALAEVRAASPVPIAADESVDSAQGRRAGEGGRRLRLRDRQALQGRRDRRGQRDLLGAADLPVERARRPGRDRRRRARGAGDLLAGPDAGLAHGLATQRLFSETTRRVECTVDDGDLHLPEGAGLGVELDEAAVEHCRV